MMAPVLPAFFYLLFLALGAYVLTRRPPFSLGCRALHVVDGVLGLCAGALSLLWCFAAAEMRHYGRDAPFGEDFERMVSDYPIGDILGAGACIAGVWIAARGVRSSIPAKLEFPELS